MQTQPSVPFRTAWVCCLPTFRINWKPFPCFESSPDEDCIEDCQRGDAVGQWVRRGEYSSLWPRGAWPNDGFAFALSQPLLHAVLLFYALHADLSAIPLRTTVA